MPAGLPLKGDRLERHEKAVDHLEATLRKVQLRGARDSGQSVNATDDGERPEHPAGPRPVPRCRILEQSSTAYVVAPHSDDTALDSPIRIEKREIEIKHKVLVNQEQQYAIWPADKDNAPGWNEVGTSGSKRERLAFIKQVWIDQRPLSVQRQDEAGASKG